MKGPYHFVSRKFGFDLDKEVHDAPSNEVPFVKKVLKLQITALAVGTAIFASDLIFAGPNFTTDSKNLYAKLGVAVLDKVLRMDTALGVTSGWAMVEASELYRELNERQPDIETN